MILVTSANGNVGRRMIPKLAEKDLDVKAMDMDPKVDELKKIGAKETFVGDLRSESDVKKAIAGCEQVLYIPPLFVYDETKLAQKCIDASINSGIKQFVMMSVTHPNMSTLPQHTAKLLAEEYLVYKGLSDGLNYTILQPMHYNHNFDITTVKNTGSYTCFYTKTTKLSYVDCEDVGEAASRVLTETGHENATYELVGGDFLSPVDMVDIYNSATGENATVNQVDVEEVIKMMNVRDSYFAETFRCLSYTYGRYGIAGNPNVLTWLLGRKPTGFREYVEKELKCS